MTRSVTCELCQRENKQLRAVIEGTIERCRMKSQSFNRDVRLSAISIGGYLRDEYRAALEPFTDEHHEHEDLSS